MGAAENVAIMQRAYDAFNAGDLDTLNEIFDENIVWHLPGRSSMAKDYQGRDATLAYFGQIAERTGGTFQAELQHLVADDDGHVVGIQRSTGERDGKSLDAGNAILFELRDGKVVDGREHFHDLYAWDEFWS
jgi:ketosteroid isomerase-like protein